jgi:hypothetical protein
MSEKQISFHGHAPGNAPILEPRLGQQQTIFLLSPANLAGRRGKTLLRESSQSELSQRLRSSQATLADVFSFVSGLYFRGKLAYANRFTHPPEGVPGVCIITASRGLLRPDYPVSLEWLRAMTECLLHPDNPGYREPLVRDAQQIKASLPEGARVILLGSIATPKYVNPLLEVFGHCLWYPQDFAGRGDMSRGSLLLRCIREDRELHYALVRK